MHVAARAAPNSLPAVVAIPKTQPITGFSMPENLYPVEQHLGAVPEGCLTLWQECILFGLSLPQFVVNYQTKT